MTYGGLKKEALRLRREGKLPKELTPEERADWAYGNAVIENDKVTVEMAREAVAEQLARK
jgi:hypothetical protein